MEDEARSENERAFDQLAKNKSIETTLTQLLAVAKHSLEKPAQTSLEDAKLLSLQVESAADNIEKVLIAIKPVTLENYLVDVLQQLDRLKSLAQE